MQPIKTLYGDDQYFDFKPYYSYIASVLPVEGSILEVGAYQGASIVWLGTELKKRNKKFKIYTIDNWMDMKDSSGVENHMRFVENVHFHGLQDTIFPLYGNSGQTGIFKYTSFDFIMIDAGHSFENVKWDIAHLYPKLKVGGKMAGHDLGMEAVRMAVNEAFPIYREFKTPKNLIWEVIKPNKKLGILVPYKNREDSLYRLIPHLHDYLTDRGFDFTIFVIEPIINFNRGKVINAGYLAIKNEIDYFVVNNVDILPVDCDYYWWNDPIHLSNENIEGDYFGSLIMFPNEKFEKLNGYSNLFSGWGAEDNDMLHRVKAAEIPVYRRLSCYVSYGHGREHCFINNHDKDLIKQKNFDSGLSDLKYEVVSDSQEYMYRHIKVKYE